jgi:hypothetical protein
MSFIKVSSAITTRFTLLASDNSPGLRGNKSASAGDRELKVIVSIKDQDLAPFAIIVFVRERIGYAGRSGGHYKKRGNNNKVRRRRATTTVRYYINHIVNRYQ